MFEKILIANRGEIALRILRAAKELGIATVAVHSTVDSEAMHVKLAERIGVHRPARRRANPISIFRRLLAACEITGADAVHPGYGFLSENAKFAEILADHDIAFIGPKAEHIRIMGDKIEAKRTVLALGIPCVPGSPGGVTDDDEAMKIALDIGFPVLVKAAAGGGGRGMKVARTRSICPKRCRWPAPKPRRPSATTRSISKNIWKSRAISRFRFSATGGETPCISANATARLQRRHQKVLEETPSPALNQDERNRIGEICASAMRKLSYSGAGTIEFLYENGEFYFIEMNTRIQVEHPITEMISGLDLVVEQIKIASGAPLAYTQADIELRGHAIECRINAEHPATFRPSPGKILYYHPPGGVGVRVDSAVYQGYVIPPNYDSLVGKLIVQGRTRNEALMRLRRALDEFIVDGIDTTLPLFRTLVRNSDIQDGAYDIHWLEHFLAAGGMDNPTG